MCLITTLFVLFFYIKSALVWGLPIPDLSKTRTRDLIYGTGPEYDSGFWPLYGALDDGPAILAERPGGVILIALFSTFNSQRQKLHQYRLIGDQYSVDAVRHALSADCFTTSGAIFRYNPASNITYPTLPHRQSIIQFYRGGTFALSLDGFNNSAINVVRVAPNNSKLPAISTRPQAGLPSNIDWTSLRCVNETIGSSLPLFSPDFFRIQAMDNEITKAVLRWGPIVLGCTGLFISITTVLFPKAKSAITLWLGRLGNLSSIASLFG